MKVEATRQDAYKLLHNGVRAFCDVEQNGIRIDMGYCRTQFKTIRTRRGELGAELKKTELARVWKKQYGHRMDLESDEQLGNILFNKLGLESSIKTKGGKDSVKAEALSHMKVPGVDLILAIRKCDRAKNKLNEIFREVIDDKIHPHFNLHTAITYRSSSNAPNFQNMDIRDADMAKLVRSCMFGAPGHHVVEVDYSGIEVHGAHWYHQDPVMYTYLCDETKDMHGDMAMQLYMLKRKQFGDGTSKPGKTTRYAAKNGFVFPEFYGSYYKTVAPNLYQYIDKLDLVTADTGMSIKLHLKKHGIRNQQHFVDHVKKVEDDFWNRRFKVYNQWKKDHYAKYLRRGYFDTLTGFRCSGIIVRNEAVNYPVQGTSFHCLLWSLIQLNRWLKKNKMRSFIMGQVHDSIVMSIHPAELQDVLAAARRIMCSQIKREWKFITTPIKIEAEVSPEGASWYEKQEYPIMS